MKLERIHSLIAIRDRADLILNNMLSIRLSKEDQKALTQKINALDAALLKTIVSLDVAKLMEE